MSREADESSTLQRVDQLISEGCFDHALQKIDSFLSTEGLPVEDRINGQFLKSRILVGMGNAQKALTLAETAVSMTKQLGKPLLLIDGLIAKATALLELGMLSKSLDIINDGQKLLMTIPEESFEFATRDSGLKLLKGKLFRKKGEPVPALEILKDCLAIQQKLGKSSVIADALNEMGIIHASKGDYKQAIQHFDQAIEIYKEFGNKAPILKLRNNIGMISWHMGMIDEALGYFHEAFTLSNELGNKRFTAAISVNIGGVLSGKGELNAALEFLQTGLTLYEELAIMTEMANCLNIIGRTYQQKGELDLALDFHQKGLEISINQGAKEEIANGYNVIGEILHAKGDYKAATTYFERSLALYEEIGHNLFTSMPLYNLIELAVENNEFEKGQQLFQRLEEIHRKEEIKAISQKYRLAKAILLKTSARPRDRGKAEGILEQIIEEEVIEHFITVKAMLHLCNLFLTELKTIDDPEMLIEVHALVGRLHVIAEQQGIHRLLAETFVLKSQLALMESDLRSARRFLSQAQVIAEKRGLRQLARQISSEHDMLLQQTTQWEELISQKPSLPDILNFTNISELLERMTTKQLKEVPEQPPEEPVYILIMGKNGLTLYSRSFQESQVHEQLIGGFLTAVQNVGTEILAGTESLDRIMYQEHTIALKGRDPLMSCYVFKGPSFLALQKLEQFLDTVQELPAVWKGLCAHAIRGIGLAAAEEEMLEHQVNVIFLNSTAAG